MQLYITQFTFVAWGQITLIILLVACTGHQIYDVGLGSYHLLTHWGRVTHICVSKLTSVGSDNGLSPGLRQAIIWTKVGILLIGPVGTNVCENLIEIHIFSFKKMRLKMASGKWRPFCLGRNALKAKYCPSRMFNGVGVNLGQHTRNEYYFGWTDNALDWICDVFTIFRYHWSSYHNCWYYHYLYNDCPDSIITTIGKTNIWLLITDISY